MSEQPAQGDQFHITVGTSVAANLDLTHEVRLLKAALLYADRVKLCSVASSMLVLLAAFANLDEEQQIEILPDLIQQIGQQSPQQVAVIAATYKQLKNKKRRNRQELITYHTVKSKLRSAWDAMRVSVDEIGRRANADGLVQAIESGIVEMRVFEVNNSDVVQQFFDEVTKAVISGNTYPLLDDTTGHLVDLAVREGKLSLLGNMEARSKQVGLSANLLSRLPLFDDVTVDEIIDIRKELERPLTRFRSAMIKYARDIRNLPWTGEFPMEADEVFFEFVEPAVLDIEDQVKSSHFLTDLLAKSVTYSIAAPSVLGVAISGLTQFPDALLYGTAGAGAIVGAYETVRDHHRSQLLIEQNQLYFYYRAGKLLGQAKR